MAILPGIEPYGFILMQTGRESPMIVADAVSFGKALRTRRKKLGYTQSYVAEVSCMSVSFISDLERGKATAELGKALFLAGLLGLDLELKER